MRIKDALKPRIFISYSHKDYKIAKPLAVKLEDKGYDVWFDEHDILTKEKFTPAIAEGIITCALFISLISNNYVNVSSKFCEQELTYANSYQKPLYPIFLENVSPPLGFDFILRNAESQNRSACNNPIEYTQAGIDEYIDNVIEALVKTEVFFKTIKDIQAGNDSLKKEIDISGINFSYINDRFKALCSGGYVSGQIYTSLFPGIQYTEFIDTEYIDTEYIDTEDIVGKKKTIKKRSENNNQLLFDYIEEHRKEHIFITGEGGSGKSIALRQIYEKFFNEHTPILYIPLSKVRFDDPNVSLESYIRDNVCGERNWNFIKYLAMNIVYKRRVILLLDGLNEVTAQKRKAETEISEIMDWPNIQVIITSRYDSSKSLASDKINKIKLLALDENSIKEHLLSKNKSLDTSNKRLLKLLSNPLMLTLYTETELSKIYSEESQKSLFNYYAITVSENPDTAGKIIYNYLISQLHTRITRNTPSVLCCFVAIEFALPLLAFMNSMGIPFDREMFKEYLEQTLSNDEQGGKYIKGRLSSLKSTLGLTDNITDITTNTITAMTHELSLVTVADSHYVFAHQSFDEFFTALFLSKQLEALLPKETTAFDKLFNTKKASLNEFAQETVSSQIYSDEIIYYLSDILAENKACPYHEGNDVIYPGKDSLQKASKFSVAERVLDNYRGKSGENIQKVVANLIRIMIRGRKNNLSNCDFSDLDLRSADLSSVFFTDWICDNFYPSKFDNSYIDASCFIKPTHHNKITAIAASKNGCIYSADESGTILVRKPDNPTPIRTYETNIEEILKIEVDESISSIALLTHHTLYIFELGTDNLVLKNTYKTNHYYKNVRFKNHQPEITFDMSPLTWRSAADTAVRSSITYDYPSKVAIWIKDDVESLRSHQTLYDKNTSTYTVQFLNTHYDSQIPTSTQISLTFDYNVKKLQMAYTSALSPDGTVLAMSINNNLIMLSCINSEYTEISRATLQSNLNNLCFVDNDTLAGSIGSSVLLFDKKCNLINEFAGNSPKRIVNKFCYDNGLLLLSSNNILTKFNDRAIVEYKRKVPCFDIKMMSPCVDCTTGKECICFLLKDNDDNICIYDIESDTLKSVYANYKIISGSLYSANMEYNIFSIGYSSIRLVDINNPKNVVIYNNYNTLNIFKCSFKNIKGTITTGEYLALIKLEGGLTDELL